MYTFIRDLNLNTKSSHRRYALLKPIPCDTEYFVENFWMPVKKRIKKETGFGIVFSVLTQDVFSLLCRDEKAIEMGLNYIDQIMGSFYPDLCSNRNDDCIGFIKPDFPVFATTDVSIILQGRLPMEREVFVKDYWTNLKKKHQRANPGVLFKLSFSADDTIMTVSAETKMENTRREQNGEPALSAEEQTTLVIIAIGQILKDLKIAISTIANEFADRLET